MIIKHTIYKHFPIFFLLFVLFFSIMGCTEQTQSPTEPVPSSGTSNTKDGLLDLFNVVNLPATHPEAFHDRGGRAVKTTATQGYLAYGQYQTGYPAQALEAYFSVFIDDNTIDNRQILTLDVYDSAQNASLAQKVITRKQFPVAGEFSLFKLTFTPVEQSRLEFRIYYHGWAYVAADRIVIGYQDQLQLRSHDELLELNPPFPPTANDPVPGEATPVPPEGVLVSESLKDGSTSGHISDGELTSEGLQLQGGYSYIGYTVSTLAQGYLEFSAQGFEHDELHGGSEYKGVLVTMWDEHVGYSYESASFIFELRKYGYIEGRPDASNSLWFKIKSNGEWAENHKVPFSWDRHTNYRFRLEWGGGQARIYRNGELLNTGTYRPEFTPGTHRIQIGANPLRGRTTPHNLLISDVEIGEL